MIGLPLEPKSPENPVNSETSEGRQQRGVTVEIILKGLAEGIKSCISANFINLNLRLSRNTALCGEHLSWGAHVVDLE